LSLVSVSSDCFLDDPVDDFLRVDPEVRLFGLFPVPVEDEAEVFPTRFRVRRTFFVPALLTRRVFTLKNKILIVLVNVAMCLLLLMMLLLLLLLLFLLLLVFLFVVVDDLLIMKKSLA
jgi:hypothetical protein